MWPSLLNREKAPRAVDVATFDLVVVAAPRGECAVEAAVGCLVAAVGSRPPEAAGPAMASESRPV